MSAESGLVRYTEPQTTHEVIIDRMRQLEAVMFRDRERRRWIEANNVTAEIREGSTSVRENTVGMDQVGKRDSSYLVAKALGIDPDLRYKGDGGYYGCNICFNMAREPVLTCCGHLFCWPCFHNLPYTEMNARECSVCGGEVEDTSIIPIYGSGSSDDSQKTHRTVYGNKVPPRPHAHRIQSLRQQVYSREELPFEAVQQRSADIIGIMEIRPQITGLGVVQIPDPTTNISGNQGYSSQLQPSPHLRVSRVLGQGIEPYSSIAFASNDSMDYMGRLIEGTQADENVHHYLRGSQETLRGNDGDSLLGIATSVQRENQTLSPPAEHHFMAPSLPSSRRNTVVNSVNETIVSPISNNPTVPSSASSRRRRTGRTASNSSIGDWNSSSS